MKTQTFKLVMLPTEKASNLFLLSHQVNGKSLHYDIKNLCKKRTSGDLSYNDELPQHLYIISNSEIKEGDWYLSKAFKREPIQHTKNGAEANLRYKINVDKIVATTDINLHWSGIPSLPESFLKAYIKAYNEGSPIVNVDLEMAQVKLYIKPEDIGQYRSKPKELQHPHTTNLDEIWNIKTRSDNTVIIHSSKKYSREDMLKSFNAGISYRDCFTDDAEFSEELKDNPNKLDFQDWIKENLLTSISSL